MGFVGLMVVDVFKRYGVGSWLICLPSLERRKGLGSGGSHCL